MSRTDTFRCAPATASSSSGSTKHVTTSCSANAYEGGAPARLESLLTSQLAVRSLERLQDSSALLQGSRVSITEHVGSRAVGVFGRLGLSMKSFHELDFLSSVRNRLAYLSFQFVEQRQSFLSNDCHVVL